MLVGNKTNIIGQLEHRPTQRADRVLIAVPTYRRADSLRRLLAAIETLDTDADIRVVVVDNEGEAGGGFAVVSEWDPIGFLSWRLPRHRRAWPMCAM